jgi:hypothetical protein
MSYQFGVWQPPSGMESIQTSRQMPFEPIISSSSPLGFQQNDTRLDPNQGSIERSTNLDSSSIVESNNPSRRFEEMIEEGWGGRQKKLGRQKDTTSSSSTYPKNPVSSLPLERPSELERKDTTTHPTFPVFTIPENNIRVRTLTYFLQMGLEYVSGSGSDSIYQHRVWTELRGASPWTFVPKGFTFPSPKTTVDFSGFGGMGCFISSVNSISLRPVTISYGVYTSFHYFVPPGFERCQPLSHFIVYALEFSPDLSTFSPVAFEGLASPPPPPPDKKNMSCCPDYNLIATIVEDKLTNQNQSIKNHVDQRTLEGLKAVNKMLQEMKIDLNLQPVIDRINEVETNLWNGPTGG